MFRSRNIEISTVSLAHRSYVIKDGLRGAGGGEFPGIEGHCKQCALVKIDQITLAILPATYRAISPPCTSVLR